MTTALSVRDLAVSYGNGWAVDGLTFDVPEGSLCAIVGPNGSGKSTTLKAIVGAITAQRGSISILGKAGKEGRRHLIYVPQRSEVDWDFPMTVRDVVNQGLYGELGLLRRAKPEQRARVEEAMQQLGIDRLADSQIGELSGGQQQRTFLARAMVQKGEVILMDEPFQGVDAATETSIVDLLRQLRSQKRTLILVHHDLSTVEDYFDHVLLMNQTPVAFGPTEDVFKIDNLQKAYGGKLAVFGEGRAAG